MVLNSIGVPPAARIPSFTFTASSRARHRFDPGVGDADDGFGEIFVSESDGFEHRARGRTIAALGNRMALQFHGRKRLV
jgi:hypothetical protein